MDREEMKVLLVNKFRKLVQNDSKLKNAYLLIHSKKLDIDLNVAEGKTDGLPAHAKQPYYIASVGKLFTAVLIGLLVERGRISFDDCISSYLDSELIEGLHVYKGTDYTTTIKIKHLLNHTSGLQDFFEEKLKQNKSMMDLVFEEPSRFWSPKEIVLWTKRYLHAHFPPGKGFHYSDTNYTLLGLIISSVTEKPFAEILKEEIFQPLGMFHSFLLQFSQPIEETEYEMADIYIRDINVKNYRSLSIDYAGGGIVSTNEDLLKFMKALVNYKIIKKDTLTHMEDWVSFIPGIDYGYGIMKIKPVPLLMPKKYSMWGNAGITGTFMFYHPELETYLIGGLNQFGYNRKGVLLMFKIIKLLTKYKKNLKGRVR